METVSLQKAEFPEDQCGLLVPAQVFVRCRAVVSRRAGGETLIVPVRSRVGELAAIYSFNQTRSVIWQALESPKRRAELIRVLEQECALEHQRAERDVTQFLNDMLSVELVEVREEVQVPTTNSRF
jgi:Coenzyme PQQ synthesis protein D (PqqD)